MDQVQATERKTMKKLILTVISLTAFNVVLAQHGTAPAGYYPFGYSGDTWTGEVSSVNDETREITLTHKKGDKTQTFTGVLVDGYTVKMKDGTDHVLKPSDLPKGTEVTVFYMSKRKKVEGKKVKYYEIFRLDFLRIGRKP
jgi:hypothetical protein